MPDTSNTFVFTEGKCWTRGGRKAIIFMANAGGSLPLIGAIYFEDGGFWQQTAWREDGRCSPYGESLFDLMPTESMLSISDKVLQVFLKEMPDSIYVTEKEEEKAIRKALALAIEAYYWERGRK